MHIDNIYYYFVICFEVVVIQSTVHFPFEMYQNVLKELNFFVVIIIPRLGVNKQGFHTDLEEENDRQYNTLQLIKEY